MSDKKENQYRNDAKRDVIERKYEVELLIQEPSVHRESISSTILGYIRNRYKRISVDSNL
jgi:hypothetical protein